MKKNNQQENKILVSCIMPTKNRRKFVPLAIHYFQRQDYPNKELVILDDGMDDVSDLIPADPNIHYHRSASDITLGAKRNMCIEACAGDLIMHWDDDDWMASHRIRYQVDELLKANAEVCGLRQMIYYEPATDQKWLYTYPANQRPWLAGNSLLYTRDFWKRSPFPNIQVASDTRFIFNHQLNRSISLADYYFYVGVIHSGNTSPKKCRGSYWVTWSDKLETIIGEDWELFQRTHLVGDEINPKIHSSPSTKNKATCTKDIAIIVTCHAPCMKYLPEALHSIDKQIPLPAERYVVFDSCEPIPGITKQWRVLRGNWGHPSSGRNAGFNATSAPWLIFWDADNIMPDGYINHIQKRLGEIAQDVAILYPDIHYCDANMKPQRLWKTPEWDYWSMRAENCVDTASSWRREAIDLVGGWSTQSALEDYVLAQDVTAAGWKACKSMAPPILKRVLSESRSISRYRNGNHLYDIWKARSLAIITLLAGRELIFHKWVDFLNKAELPPKTALYVLDNSGNEEFTQQAFDTCRHILKSRRMTHLYFSSTGRPHLAEGKDRNQIKMRHEHVARLYTSIFPKIHEEFILTLEDDVEPPLDSIRKLGSEFGWYSPEKIGAIAAAYPMAHIAGCVCAGTGSKNWGEAIRWQQLKDKPIEVGCVGGGCTMWANWAIRGQPINFWWDRKMGWDASLSAQIKKKGYRVLLHGGVRCQHHSHGTINVKTIQQKSNSKKLTVPKKLLSSINKNTDSWIPSAELGTRIPPYKPTFNIHGFLNETHQSFSTCPLFQGQCIDVGIRGWLRREDALKLYEIAYIVQSDILELGCNHGLSTSILAQAVIDSKKRGRIYSIDIESLYVRKTKENLKRKGINNYVNMICGDGTEQCRQLIQEGKSFEFIFVDHSHKYHDVAEFCKILPRLLLDQGFCLFHDFNDGRNNDPSLVDYKVSQAVCESLDLNDFEFYGIFGCSALYRKR